MSDNIQNVLITFVIEQEEPYEGRLSRTVPWEPKGETPLGDSTGCNWHASTGGIPPENIDEYWNDLNDYIESRSKENCANGIVLSSGNLYQRIDATKPAVQH